MTIKNKMADQLGHKLYMTVLLRCHNRLDPSDRSSDLVPFIVRRQYEGDGGRGGDGGRDRGKGEKWPEREMRNRSSMPFSSTVCFQCLTCPHDPLHMRRHVRSAELICKYFPCGFGRGDDQFLKVFHTDGD